MPMITSLYPVYDIALCSKRYNGTAIGKSKFTYCKSSFILQDLYHVYFERLQLTKLKVSWTKYNVLFFLRKWAVILKMRYHK